MQNIGLIMNDCQKFRNMKTRKVFPKKAFPPHCAKRHVNLEMGYSWYNTVIWAKRKSAPTLSKCVSPRSGVSKGLFPTLSPKSLQYIAVAELWCTMYVFAYYLCKGLCYVSVLIMELPIVKLLSQHMKWRTFLDFWLIIENEKKIL